MAMGLLHQASQWRNTGANTGQPPSKGECRDCMELEICISLRSSGPSLPRSDGSRSQNGVGGGKIEKHTQKAL